MTDPTRFKISHLTGDISCGKLPPSQPLPTLTPEEHSQLRSHLQQECDWHREYSGVPGGKKDWFFTDRIAESLRREKEIISAGADKLGGKDDGRTQGGVKVGEKVNEKALKEFEKMVKAISSAALMEFRVGLSLVVRDMNVQVRKEFEAVFEAMRVEKEDDEVSVVTLVDECSPSPSKSVQVDKNDELELSVALDCFEKAGTPAKAAVKDFGFSDAGNWMQGFAFSVCLVQLFGFGFRVTRWVLERNLESNPGV